MRWIIAAVILLLIGIISGCALLQKSIKEPTVSIEKIRLDTLGLDGAAPLAQVRIDNPNRVGTTLEGLNYTLHLNDQRLLSGSSDETIRIGANESRLITLPVSIDFKEAAGSIGSLTRAPQATYHLTVDAKLNLPVLGARSLSAEKSGTFALPMLPKLTLEHISLSNLTFTGAQLEIALLLDNPGGVDYRLEALNYALMLDGRAIAALQSAPDQLLKSGQRTPLTLTLELDLRSLGLGIYRQLSQSGAGLTLEGDATLRPLHPLMEGVSQLPFKKSGSL
jgi:LEA14-like dessication related protein